MDRLICGDVGFGKTRSQFAPRSRLSKADARLPCWSQPRARQQHLNTFRERMAAIRSRLK